MNTRLVFSALSLALGIHSAAVAQVTTTPVGFNTVTCLPNSDTYCSVPFAQSWEFQGLISGTPAVSGDDATITPQGTVSWTANQYASAYFVRMLTGTKAGMYYQVSANAAGNLTIDLAGGDFVGVAEGDSFAVSKFWTLATLFPPATQTTIVASTSTLPAGRRTQLMLPDILGNGINRAPSRAFFIHAGIWKEATTGFPDASNTLLSPDSYFIVRHNHSSITAATTFTAAGLVELNPVAMPLATQAAAQQDNAIATGRPVPVKLKDLDLGGTSAFVGSAGTLPAQRRDQLLVFNNSVASVNRAPSAIYFYVNSTANWREAATGFPVADDVEIPPSSAIMIRKYQSGSGTTAVWTHNF